MGRSRLPIPDDVSAGFVAAYLPLRSHVAANKHGHEGTVVHRLVSRPEPKAALIPTHLRRSPTVTSAHRSHGHSD